MVPNLSLCIYACSWSKCCLESMPAEQDQLPHGTIPAGIKPGPGSNGTARNHSNQVRNHSCSGTIPQLPNEALGLSARTGPNTDHLFPFIFHGNGRFLQRPNLEKRQSQTGKFILDFFSSVLASGHHKFLFLQGTRVQVKQNIIIIHLAWHRILIFSNNIISYPNISFRFSLNNYIAKGSPFPSSSVPQSPDSSFLQSWRQTCLMLSMIVFFMFQASI